MFIFSPAVISRPVHGLDETRNSGEPLRMLQNACRVGDQKEISHQVGEIKSLWGKSPDLEKIKRVILARKADPTFRWTMLDSLNHYKRSINSEKEAGFLLNTLDEVSWSEKEDPIVRAKAITVEAGVITLFMERGLIGEDRLNDFGERVAGLLSREKDEGLQSAGCIAAGRARSKKAIPILRRYLQNSETPSLLRRQAACSLGKLDDRRSIPLLALILRETEDRKMYSTAAFALGMLGGEEVIASLVESAHRFESNSCRNALRKNQEAVRRIITKQAADGIDRPLLSPETNILDAINPKKISKK